MFQVLQVYTSADLQYTFIILDSRDNPFQIIFKFLPLFCAAWRQNNYKRILDSFNRTKSYKKYWNWAATWDFQRFDILTCVDSEEPLQPPSKLRNSKWCSVSSLTIIEYSSDKQRLWSDCAYAQADLRLCWSHIPHCWKSHALAQILSKALESFFQHFSRQILFSWIYINIHF